jgi:guanylate kinase
MTNDYPTSGAQLLRRLQRRLMEELQEIASRLKLDYTDIKHYHPSERTIHLQIMKDKSYNSRK